MIGWLIIPVLVLTVAGYCWQIRRSRDLRRYTAVYWRNLLVESLLFAAAVALSIALMRASTW